jgi:hypothetical protein
MVAGMRAPQLIFGLLGVAWCACSDSSPAQKDGPPPVKGSTYTSITGVLHYLADNTMILPRSTADLVK